MKKCVCLMGVDGSGKTTLATEYRKFLNSKGVVSTLVWSRYRNYISKPFLAITRLTGHNQKMVINGTKIGYHHFERNKFIALTFLLLQWCDQVFDVFYRFRGKKTLIVSDRCVIDTLVDLCVDTGMEDFIFGAYGKTLIRLMPKQTCFFVVERNKSDVFKCRPDVMVDKNYEKRQILYKRAISELNLTLIDNNKSIDSSIKRISEIVGIN